MNKYFENIGALEELRKQYKELLKLHHPDNGGSLETMQKINAEYDRQWIWVSGSTYSFRKELKEAGYKYAPKKNNSIFIQRHSGRKAAKHYLWKILRNCM